MKWYEVAFGVGVVLWLVRRATHTDAAEVPLAQVRKDLFEVFAARGWPQAEVDRVIRIESGWRPGAVNSETHAVGLTQFLPSYLPRLGFLAGWQTYARLSAAEQIPYIKRWLARSPRGSGIPGDTYVLFAAPKFVGMPGDTIAYPVNSPGWKANPLWREPGDGPVTVAALRKVLLSRM